MDKKKIHKVFIIVCKIFTIYAIVNILFLSLMIATSLSSLLQIFFGNSIFAMLFLGYILFKIQNFHIVFYAIYAVCHIVKCILEKRILLAILGLFIIILGIALNYYCIINVAEWTAKISW